MNDQLPEDDVPVSDRRRFTADGEPRPGFDETSNAAEPAAAPGGAEPAAAEMLPEVVPAEEAREWERRARAAEARLAEVAEGYRRGREELDGVRARLERDQERRVQDALGRAFTQILAALDDLERALAHAEGNPIAEGVRLVHRRILDALAAQGLERMELAGQAFDPNTAEAVMTSPAGSEETRNTVAEEFRPGYRLGDRVIRPAQVRVLM